MALAFKCDICGKFFDYSITKEEIKCRKFFYDLCPNCYKEFISSIEKLKQEKEQKNNG